MKVKKYSQIVFLSVYLSIVQIMVKLIDSTFLFGEVGRGSGKTTHMLAPRIDRVQNGMAGSLLVLAAATYKSIIDNILPGVLEYFLENYERGVYFEYAKQPPAHFGIPTLENPHWSRTEIEKITDFKHTITFVTGTVIKFVSCDRPESMLGLNAAHLFIDEMIRIPEDKFIERIIPALRADRSKFGHSHYFMGITGFSSTPNFETDEDWWTKYESDMNPKLMKRILEVSYHVDMRMAAQIEANANADFEEEKKHQRFLNRWLPRLNAARRGQTLYMRASSFSNIKILGIDYIRNQIKSIKDTDKLNTSILAVRKTKVKDMFFGRFGKQHLFEDGYDYRRTDKLRIDNEIEWLSSDLKYCNPNMPLIAGYDPGPFSSIIFAQEEKLKKIFRVIKNMWVYHPDQHDELAEKIDTYFRNHKRKEIFLYYDRAANQKDPEYRKYYPVSGGLNDTDANLLAAALKSRRWTVHLMSKGQETIYYGQHYTLLNMLFGPREASDWQVLIDRNECEALVSSINHSPLKRNEKRVELDKSSERLDFEDQAYYSTQLSSAFMYLLWGKFNHLLPASARKKEVYIGTGTYTSD
ncbi:hypothetical protein IR083_10220 [Dysgonomonas sp. GY75]|uniref:hypothetical protein n=1 Tax=Dysgonomonas sp. GY75 TaxID=2780419 RepID=UPI001883B958|nr:hypothetical protein [Dysgonomonas sp. GY75]MBF0649196.1 hypothetical protein [Dysgonomonas sp. GY75]